MEPNPILAEIRAIREKMDQESNYDVRKFMAAVRQREVEAEKQGMVFAPSSKVKAAQPE